MNENIEEVIEDAAVDTLQKQNAKLLRAVRDLVRTGQTPNQIDSFVANRFGLKKGHPVRDLCYLAACSIERARTSHDPDAFDKQLAAARKMVKI